MPNSISPHPDHHAIAFDANGLLLDGNDGGIFRLDNPSVPTWADLNSNTNSIQFEGIDLHPTNPNIVAGGSQDNGTEIYTGSLKLARYGGRGWGPCEIQPYQPKPGLSHDAAA